MVLLAAHHGVRQQARPRHPVCQLDENGQNESPAVNRTADPPVPAARRVDGCRPAGLGLQKVRLGEKLLREESNENTEGIRLLLP